MSDAQQPPDKDPPFEPREDPKVPPDTLELRAPPAPITRINRTMLLGVAFVGLLALAGLVIVAFNPPKFTTKSPSELLNTGQRATPEGLNNLPADYRGLQPPRPAAKPEPARGITPTVPFGSKTAAIDKEQVERDRLARLAIQAKESALFFRLQLKAAPKKDEGGEARSAASISAPLPAPPTAAASLTALAPSRRSGEGADDSAVADPTEQNRKLAFLKSASDKDIYNPHALQKPASPYQLMAGTIIAASLLSGLNSDLPGFVIAQITEPVYDTATGRSLLIPQGTRIIGKYDSVVAFGQERALVVWQRLIFPDATSIVIDNLPATDAAGYAGLADEVDVHTWKILKGIALATLLGVGSELAFGSSSTQSDLVRALRQSTEGTTNRAGQRIVERNLNVQPTITVRPGWPLRIIVHKDLILRPYRNAGATAR